MSVAIAFEYRLAESRRHDDWETRLRSRIKSIAKILMALAMLLAAADLVIERGKNVLCDTLNVCPSKTSRAIAIWPFASRVAESSPVLAAYESSWMSGGATAEAACAPRRQMYAEQYPSYAIALESRSETRKDFLGHVSYRFSCLYHASPKAPDG